MYVSEVQLVACLGVALTLASGQDRYRGEDTAGTGIFPVHDTDFRFFLATTDEVSTILMETETSQIHPQLSKPLKQHASLMITPTFQGLVNNTVNPALTASASM